MKENFVDSLRKKRYGGKPIVVLAPMADVTDEVFRKMIERYSMPSGPDVFWTEFVSADGLSHKIGKKKLLFDLRFSKKELPILAQIFGANKENLIKATKIVYNLGFSGIDINMGCPDKSIEKQGAGAAMIRNPDLVREILRDLKKKINILNNPSSLKLRQDKEKRFFSFSIKTRIGFNKVEYENWFPNILDFEPDIFTVHLRTRKELSLVSAHWELAKEVVIFIKKYCEKNKLKVPFIILNGDVKDVVDAKNKIKISGADGVMIGRGVFGTPWLFDEKEYKKRLEQNLNTKKGKENILFRLKVLLEHTKEFEKKMTKIKSFNIMKKHYKAYVNGFDGAKDLRNDLMLAKDYKEVKKITNKFICLHLSSSETYKK
jgi:nifR3 family TIM-barrel protein